MNVPVAAEQLASIAGMLAEELDGYAEYRQKVRARLVPRVW